MDNADLLLAVLAARNGFISEDQLLEAAALRAAAGAPAMGEILKEKFGVAEADLELLRSVAGARRTKAAGGADAPETMAAPPRIPAQVRKDGGKAARYLLGDEIARGGLGRIVEAFDRDLDRDVAIKLVIDEGAQDLAARFAREAHITARLDHPNVVPVHDYGEIVAEDGGRQLFLCMKRIKGRDLSSVLAELAAKNDAARQKWTRARLLAVFQDICLGIAYAHSRGVLHRDLKPANVMVGEFGEVLIVDWGLAKIFGDPSPRKVWRAGQTRITLMSGLAAPDPAKAKLPASATPFAPTPDLTFAGEVLGTPAYMSPEQAEGRMEDLDPRSDIYSLGTILFQILTLQPPFAGDNLFVILGKVASGDFPRPSALADIPPELEAVVLKAMAARPEDRHASALDLHRDIQLFLEDVRERERLRRDAARLVNEGRIAAAKWLELRKEIAAQQKRASALDASIAPHAPLEAKRPFWEAEAELRRLAEERVDAWFRSARAFEQAMVLEPGSEEAADERCRLAVKRYLEAEETRDEAEMRAQRRSLEAMDAKKRHLPALDGFGALTIRAFARDCGCLERVTAKGWKVEFGAKADVPWRGGRPLPGEAARPDDQPVPALRVSGGRFGHTAACVRREARGVEVLAAPVVERDRRKVPGEFRPLGPTPLEGVRLPQGSWVLKLRAPGFADLTVPVLVRRDAAWSQDVNLYRPGEIPDGFVPVPGGPFVFLGGTHSDHFEARDETAEDFFAARFAVTCGEYLEFLNALPLEEARRRAPRSTTRVVWPEEKGRFVLSPDEPRWAVAGVDWASALAYAAWRSTKEGRVYALLHETEFEKAARGVDGRDFPFGDHFDATFCHSSRSQPGEPRRLPVGSFPLDESPYGVRDLAGGMSTWCLCATTDSHAYAMIKGGSWANSSLWSRSNYRFALLPDQVNFVTGIRLALRPFSWA